MKSSFLNLPHSLWRTFTATLGIWSGLFMTYVYAHPTSLEGNLLLSNTAAVSVILPILGSFILRFRVPALASLGRNLALYGVISLVLTVTLYHLQQAFATFLF